MNYSKSTDKTVEITELSRKIYLQLPFWKRWQFMRYMESNNWDVKDVYSKCMREAKYIIEEEQRFNTFIK